MMKTYRLSPQATERDSNAVLIRSLSFSTLILLGSLLLVLRSEHVSEPRMLILLISGFALLILFIWYRTIRKFRGLKAVAIETYELTVDDLQITRSQRDTPTVVVPRSGIKKISERAGQGFRIETQSARVNIWVPRELDGYDEVKQMLVASTAASTSMVRYPLALTYGISVITLIAMFIVMKSNSRPLVTTVGIALLGAFVWNVIYVMRVGSGLSRQAKRSIWIIVLPAFMIVARIVSVWR
jgi:hypothetical protein